MAQPGVQRFELGGSPIRIVGVRPRLRTPSQSLAVRPVAEQCHHGIGESAWILDGNRHRRRRGQFGDDSHGCANGGHACQRCLAHGDSLALVLRRLQ